MIIDEIKAKINKVLEAEFEIEPERLKPDAALFTDLELDSLDVVDLIVALEQAFNIKIRTVTLATLLFNILVFARKCPSLFHKVWHQWNFLTAPLI